MVSVEQANEIVAKNLMKDLFNRASIPRIWLQSVARVEQWYRPKSAVEGAASMASIIAPSRATSIDELQRFIIMYWEFCVAEHEARHNEYVQDPSRSQHARGC